MLTVVLVSAPYTDHGNNQGESNRPIPRKRAMETDKLKEVQNYSPRSHTAPEILSAAAP